MSKYKKIEPRNYILKAERLPDSSYRKYPYNEGEAIPFILAGKGGLQEHKQLNWTNLFLIDKLGTNYEQLYQKYREENTQEFKDLVEQLPEKIRKEIAKNPNILKEIRKPLEIRNYYIQKKINLLNNEIKFIQEQIIKINNVLEKLAHNLGISDLWTK